MAEAVMRKLTAHMKPAWRIESAGLADWNVGRPPEPRALQVLAFYGYTSDHIGRKMTSGDYKRYDFIFGMDDENMEEIVGRIPDICTARMEALVSYDYGRTHVIADPYFVSSRMVVKSIYSLNRFPFQDEGIKAFELAFNQIERCCRNFLMGLPPGVFHEPDESNAINATIE